MCIIQNPGHGSGIVREGGLQHFFGFLCQFVNKSEVFFQPPGDPVDVCVIGYAVFRHAAEININAIGCYGLDPVRYAKMLYARWAELTGVEDCFR